MIIYPAIDLKEGQCVRLYKGAMDQATIYHEHPEAQARIFEEEGFEALHIVDLNGAINGLPANSQAVKKILNSVKLPVQIGGGIRSMTHIETWLNMGAARVILGTVAVKDPELVRTACDAFPGQVVLGLDARGDRVAVEGWVENSETTIFDMARRFEDAGAAAIIYTDINRDGTGDGLNLELTGELAQSTDIPVIASGGVGSMKDIQGVAELESKGVQGVIVGRALYDGRLSAKDLLNA
jgi:phosphoribosylformimino-5-aminoimidazole carboxamide ribotide isomerase